MSSSGFQIREALEVQLDVQRRLHEQLEVLVGLFLDDLLRGVVRFIQDHDDQTFEWPSLQFHLPIITNFAYIFLWQIQKILQLRIEEQGKQLKMMFDQQQKKTNSLLNNQNLNITSPDESTFSLEDIDVSIVEGSNNNTHFPSKIS